MRLVVKSKTRKKRKKTVGSDPAANSQTDQSGESGDEEPGFEELFELLRGKLTFYFAAQQCYDPEELADITLMRVYEKIKKNVEISDLTRYSFGVAKHVLQEYWRRGILESIDAQKHQFAVKSSADENDGEIREQKLACMEKCMERLKEQERTTLLEYYDCKGEDRLKMAEQLNITRETLTLRIYHLRQRLKKCMNACLKNM